MRETYVTLPVKAKHDRKKDRQTDRQQTGGQRGTVSSALSRQQPHSYLKLDEA